MTDTNPAGTIATGQSPSGLAEDTAARLRAQVIAGHLRPGQRLSETRLAGDLSVSRNTLREVFRLLTREGLLTHAPNRGVSVAVPTMAGVLDIYRVRRLIEVPALAQAWVAFGVLESHLPSPSKSHRYLAMLPEESCAERSSVSPICPHGSAS